MYDIDMQNNRWIMRGNATIEGEAVGDQFGYSISLSFDGNTIVIGGPGNSDDQLSGQGHTQVYRYDEDVEKWIMLGDINGEGNHDLSGFSVAISGDGDSFISGAPDNKDADFHAGHARVYRYIEGAKAFEQMGSDIDGDIYYGSAGSSVSINEDGTVVAVGSQVVRVSTGPGQEELHPSDNVKVYSYDWDNNAWIQRGNTLDVKEKPGDQPGYKVSLSSDGETVAIGNGKGFSGYFARVYEYNSTSNTWQQTGEDLAYSYEHKYAGSRTRLSGNKKTVAIGSFYSNGVHFYRMCPKVEDGEEHRPSYDTCEDDGKFRFGKRGKRGCQWVSRMMNEKPKKARKFCTRKKDIALHCAKSCGYCGV